MYRIENHRLHHGQIVGQENRMMRVFEIDHWQMNEHQVNKNKLY